MHDASFRVRRNTVFGLLGPNGSGKSTTINCATRRVLPDVGDVTYEGVSIEEKAAPLYAKARLGCCLQTDALFKYMSVREHLVFYAHLRCQPSPTVDAAILRMEQSLGLTGVSNTLAGNLSGGNKRRLCVGVALITGSKLVNIIVFCDEN